MILDPGRRGRKPVQEGVPVGRYPDCGGVGDLRREHNVLGLHPGGGPSMLLGERLGSSSKPVGQQGARINLGQGKFDLDPLRALQ